VKATGETLLYHSTAGTNKQHVDCTRREGVSQRLRG
jgi:hypothetical protein